MFQYMQGRMVDSQVVLQSIEQDTLFRVRKDMTRSSKREDTLAYLLEFPYQQLQKILSTDSSDLPDTINIENVAVEQMDAWMRAIDEYAELVIPKLLGPDLIMKSQTFTWNEQRQSFRSLLVVVGLAIEKKRKTLIGRMLGEANGIE